MSTNQAFIKAYRHDTPRTAVARAGEARADGARPSKRCSRPSRSSALWQSTVEIAAANYSAGRRPTSSPARRSPDRPPPARLSTATTSSPTPTIGKRPLSSFAPEPAAERPLLLAEPTFIPETTISAFRWPQVCRALWERYADQLRTHRRTAACPAPSANRAAARSSASARCTPATARRRRRLCLAVALAARKKSVILVDANFRAPRLAGLLGVQPSTSWQDVLEQGLPVAEAVIRAENDGIDLLPLDLREPTPASPTAPSSPPACKRPSPPASSATRTKSCSSTSARSSPRGRSPRSAS